MSDQPKIPANPESQPPTDADASEIDVKTPDFAQVDDADAQPAEGSMTRFYDVNVTVSAELGRVTMSLGELLKLGEGSVLELDRPVTAPIDVMSQGVRLARGEVVVIDDSFAVRIKEIEPPQRRSP